MKCKNCCFYIIIDPDRNNKIVCVRNPPIYMKNEFGRYETMFPRPSSTWWCGEWKPEGFIKMWPDNLTKEFK